MNNCIFCKIVNKEVPSEIIYEDDEIISFKDINPVTPVHVLVIPKKHIEKITDLKKDDELLIGKIYAVINEVAKKLGIAEEGFRVIVNCGENGGQEVNHIHFHVLGGKKLGEKVADCNN